MLPLFSEILKNKKVVEELQQNPRGFRFPYGANILVGVSQWQPHVEVVKEPPPDGVGGTMFIRGPVGELFNLIAKSMNFTYTLIEPPDGSWGSQLPNGSWKGMIGQVTRKEVDVALGPFGQTQSRSEVVDFTQPLQFSMKRLLLAKNRPEIDPWGFLFPLSSTVWGSLMIALVAVWIVSVLLEYCAEKRVGYSTAFSYLFNQVSIFLQQGISLNSNVLWKTLISYAWLILVTVVAWSYAGNLMSQLAVRYIPESIKTVQDMVDTSKLTLIQLNNTALTDYLSTVKSGVFREVALLWDKGRMKYMEDSEFLGAVDTLVRQGDHVILTTSLTADMYMANLYTRTGKCDFYKAREEFLPLTLGIVTQKNSLLMPAMNARIGYLLAAGLYDYWLMNSFDNSTSCLNLPSKITVQAPLGLSNIWGMYVMLGAGLLISLVVFLLEVVIGFLTEMNAT
ncbi:probable glutamate receptor [Palaemon carinicauda]|uniref:probable glutamate receptor n=1 Tax=Palaemon carinicauda TaxID=392227 RepID=UPI0035B5C272